MDRSLLLSDQSTNWLERSEMLRRRDRFTNVLARSERLRRQTSPTIAASEARRLEGKLGHLSPRAKQEAKKGDESTNCLERIERLKNGRLRR